MLWVSAELEAKANSLQKEALQSLTIALARSDTRHFWDLLTAFFGANHTGDNDDPWDFLDAPPEIPPPLPVTDTKSDDEKASVTSAATTKLAPVVPITSVPPPKKQASNLGPEGPPSSSLFIGCCHLGLLP